MKRNLKSKLFLSFQIFVFAFRSRPALYSRVSAVPVSYLSPNVKILFRQHDVYITLLVNLKGD